MKTPRILLLIPTHSYRAKAFMEAAAKLKVEVVVGSDAPQALAGVVPGRSLTVDFSDPDRSLKAILEFARDDPLDAVIPTEDETTPLAAIASQALSLPHHPVEAVLVCRNKFLFRQILSKSGLPSPSFERLSVEADPKDVARRISYPCVLKPLALSASRGVLRADTPDQFASAFHRIKAILTEPDAIARGKEEARFLLMEEYLPGREVALEGLLRDGTLRVLALFDKPDLLEGPTFEETIYVTPSRLAHNVQEKIAFTTVKASRALGLRHGPLHAELRLNEKGIWPLEVAARSIGGHCSKALRFATGMSLEELLLRHAIGAEMDTYDREDLASGVMMIPIPKGGILQEVLGLEEARAVPSVEGIEISIKKGQPVVPLPEGSRYLGFIFARHEKPERVEAALRESHRKLEFVITK